MRSTVVVFAMEAMPHLRLGARLLVGGLTRARAVHLCRPRGDGARKIELVGGSDLGGFSAPCGTHLLEHLSSLGVARAVGLALLELGHDLVQKWAGLCDEGVGLRCSDLGTMEDAHGIGPMGKDRRPSGEALAPTGLVFLAPAARLDGGLTLVSIAEESLRADLEGRHPLPAGLGHGLRLGPRVEALHFLRADRCTLARVAKCTDPVFTEAAHVVDEGLEITAERAHEKRRRGQREPECCRPVAAEVEIGPLDPETTEIGRAAWRGPG